MGTATGKSRAHLLILVCKKARARKKLPDVLCCQAFLLEETSIELKRDPRQGNRWNGGFLAVLTSSYRFGPLYRCPALSGLCMGTYTWYLRLEVQGLSRAKSSVIARYN